MENKTYSYKKLSHFNDMLKMSNEPNKINPYTDKQFEEYFKKYKEDFKKYNEEIEYFRSIDIKRSDYEVDEKWFKANTPEINVEGLPTWMRVPEKELTFENVPVPEVLQIAEVAAPPNDPPNVAVVPWQIV